jgi:hypothetical protein
MKNLMFLLVAILMLGFTSCKKEPLAKPPVSGKTGTISFTPTFYGNVLPWNNKESNKKGFTEFQHKYFSHTIRILTDAGAFVEDIPFAFDVSSCDATLPVGSYIAQFIPITEDAADLVYGVPVTSPLTEISVATIAGQSFSKAGIFTPANVSFTVTEDFVTSVHLTTVTPFSLLLFQIDTDQTYVQASLPVPEIWRVIDPTFLGLHGLTGQEQATFNQLAGVTNVTGRYHFGVNDVADILTPGTTEISSFWWDVTAGIYYMYVVPGAESGTVEVSDGDDVVGSVPTEWATYFAYDLTGGTGSLLKTPWLHDYYSSRDWTNNMTLRLRFVEGAIITIGQEDWFQNTIEVNP